MRTVAFFAALSLASVVVDTRASQQGAIAREVARAKASGQTEITIGRVLSGGDYRPGVRQAFGGLHAIVISRPRMDVAQVIAPDAIYSLTHAAVDVVLFEPDGVSRYAEFCTGTSTVPAPEQGYVTLPLKRGQAVVDGVTVQMAGPDANLQLNDDRYLVLGAFCAPAVMAAVQFYPLSDDGTIWPLHLFGRNTVDLTNPGILRQAMLDRVPAFLTAVERDPARVDREIRERAAAEPPGGPAAITGRVVDRSGMGIPGTPVTAYQRNGPLVVSAVTDTDGRYRITALPASEYRVVISLAGFSPSGGEYFDLAGPTVIDATLRLEGFGGPLILETPTGQLTGRVIDQHDRPWPLASVTIDFGFLGRITTNDDGRFALPQVQPGRYPMRIAAAGHVLFETSVTIQRDRTTRITAKLERTSAVPESRSFVRPPPSRVFRVETGDGAWTMEVTEPAAAMADEFLADVTAHRFDFRQLSATVSGALELVDDHRPGRRWTMQILDGVTAVTIVVRDADRSGDGFTARVTAGGDIARRVRALIDAERITRDRPLPLLAVSRAR